MFLFRGHQLNNGGPFPPLSGSPGFLSIVDHSNLVKVVWKNDFTVQYAWDICEKCTLRVAWIKLGCRQENLPNFNKIATIHWGVPEKHVSQFLWKYLKPNYDTLSTEHDCVLNGSRCILWLFYRALKCIAWNALEEWKHYIIKDSNKHYSVLQNCLIPSITMTNGKTGAQTKMKQWKLKRVL